MATVNVTVSEAWTKVGDGEDTGLSVQIPHYDCEWEVAAVATEVPPTVEGHRLLGPYMQVTRADLGPGFVYARIVSGPTTTAVVSKYVAA
jgi:hypothetical protein